jgi:hypothetical protein
MCCCPAAKVYAASLPQASIAARRNASRFGVLQSVGGGEELQSSCFGAAQRRIFARLPRGETLHAQAFVDVD